MDAAELPVDGSHPGEAGPHVAGPQSNTSAILRSSISAIVPGVGHLMAGDHGAGAVFLLLFAATSLPFWPARVVDQLPVMAVLVWAMIFLLIASGVHCFAMSRKTAGLGWEWLLLVILVALSSAVLWANVLTRAEGLKPFSMPSSSMVKTILQDEAVMADMRSFKIRPPQRGDIVIFKRDRIFIVKRVIAVGGDTIQGTDEGVLLNGKLLDEPFVVHLGQFDASRTYFGPITMPPHKLFMMGDNRDYSLDSRHYGPIDENVVVARPLFVYRSPSPGRIGKDVR